MRHNVSTDDRCSISEHSNSDYNTTDEIDYTEEQKPNNTLLQTIEEKVVIRQKRSFDVDTLLAPEAPDAKKNKFLKESADYKLIKKIIQVDSTSSSLSSSTVSSPSSSSSPITSTLESNLNINQSLLSARSYYNSILSNNNPSSMFFYNQLSASKISFTNEVSDEQNTKKKKVEKQPNPRRHDSEISKMKTNSDREKSRIKSLNSDVEKWNETFSKIMARSYKSHSAPISAINSNSKIIKSYKGK